MGKLVCICDHIIVDQTDYLPYKADIVPDKKYFGLFDKLDGIIETLIEAVKTGDKQAWIKSHFLPDYPTDLRYDQMVSDLFIRYYVDASKRVYQCEKCGRIWIQQGKSERFVPFVPEDDNWKDILSE